MEKHQERSVVLRPSHELVAAQSARGRILGEIVESLLAISKEDALAKVNLDELVRLGKQCQDVRFAYGEPPQQTSENIQAFSLLHKAASAGHPEAQYIVSHCYHFGIGVDKDLAKTLEWLTLSAEAGFPSAQSSLGACFEHEYLVPLDRVAAMKWYQKAAEQNDGGGQDRLGTLYLGGKGDVKRDLVQAYKWLKLARENGVAMIWDKALTVAAPLMTPSEIEAANGFYREFKDRLRNQENKGRL